MRPGSPYPSRPAIALIVRFAPRRSRRASRIRRSVIHSPTVRPVRSFISVDRCPLLCATAAATSLREICSWYRVSMRQGLADSNRLGAGLIGRGLLRCSRCGAHVAPCAARSGSPTIAVDPRWVPRVGAPHGWIGRTEPAASGIARTRMKRSHRGSGHRGRRAPSRLDIHQLKEVVSVCLRTRRTIRRRVRCGRQDHN
jgi:hypothetical protein